MGYDNCGDKIGACLKKTNARCVTYEGKHSECSELDCCDRPSVHDTLEDMSDQFSAICSAIDTAGLGDLCLEYDGTGEEGEVLVKDVLLKLEQTVCDLKENIQEEGECNPIFNQDITCAGLDLSCLVDECGEQPSTFKEVLQIMINEICKR